MPPKGLTQEEVSLIKSCFAAHLQSGQSIVVHLFGSRAKGTHKKFSDVDLLVQARPNLTDQASNDIKEALEESKLPYLVDVVKDEDLADTHRPSAEADKVLLFKLP